MSHRSASSAFGSKRGIVWPRAAPVGDVDNIRVDIAQQRDATVQALARRFDDAHAGGELPGMNTLVAARWIIAVCHGFSVHARSGATREELHDVSDLALAGWPERSRM